MLSAPDRRARRLKTLFVVSLVLYIGIQVWLVSSPIPFLSDSANYVRYARLALEEHTYYPNPQSLYSAWIVAPVYINYTAVILKVFEDTYSILWFNIMLNLIQLALVMLIVRRWYGEVAGYVAAFLYMLYLNNLGLVMQNVTELMFGVFMLASIYYYTGEKKTSNAILCGIFTGLALGVRPTAMALILVYILIYLYDVYTRKYEHKQIVLILAGVVCYCLAMGMLSKRNIGQFEYTSTTGPSNLILSAIPEANGVFYGQFFKTDGTYRAIKTYPERDKYLMQRSRRYIAAHPMKWVGLIPRKIYSTFVFDGWAVEHLLGSSTWNLNTYLKGGASVKQKFQKLPVLTRVKFWVFNVWQQVLYGVMMVIFLYQLYRLIRKKGRREEYLINLFILIGVGLSIVSSVGNPRYKYNFLIAAILVISPVIAQWTMRAHRRLLKTR
jgi:hypothetical protein